MQSSESQGFTPLVICAICDSLQATQYTLSCQLALSLPSGGKGGQCQVGQCQVGQCQVGVNKIMI